MSDYHSSGKSDPAAEADAWMVALAESLAESRAPIAARMGFVRWLKRSPVHVEEYLRTASIRALVRSYPSASAANTASAGEMANLSDEAANTAQTSERSNPLPSNNIIPWPWNRPPTAPPSERTGHIRRAIRDRRRGRWVRRMASMAAAGLLAMVVGLGSQQFLDREEIIHAATARGDIEDLVLPDGTQLALNTNTSITVKLRRSSRTVEIHRGQVFIDVAADEERPLRVVSRDAVMTDIGTRFDVYVRPRDTVVTVLDGHVVVSPPRKDGKPAAIGTEPVLVSAGEQAAVDSRGQVGQVEAIKASTATAWREQRLEFDDMPLGDIAHEFNRYNDMRIDVRDPHIADLRLSGSFATTDPDSFLAIVERLPEVKVQRLGERYTKITREM